ncbi:uncharacterized protein LY79DRAFT_125997 [Colletotrichum navitas]|uniref:Stress-associated endoplasmic reticulum protein n=1 Tax=Colletotrichum navitas TaxID=681940 RepID=A0AAD8Q3D7_9PEZI|nr:uncharacterized protein LY79DRAFT_125997 [Colletotrichum navitas]KAK1594805.1 hypothetical protein LY79DRAFT_125997 [Colletotrichum navitas]
MAQTPQQRRANAKFAKDNESRMGKSEDQIKKRTKEAPKSPISPVSSPSSSLAVSSLRPALACLASELIRPSFALSHKRSSRGRTRG